MIKLDVTAGYRPGENEPYMNARQLDYFKRVLLEWRRRQLREDRSTLTALHQNEPAPADHLDHSAQMADKEFALTSKLRNRQRLAQIEAALQRIDEGSYGYCLESGEPIGLRRLEALPFATLSVEAQEQIEHSRRINYYGSNEQMEVGRFF